MAIVKMSKFNLIAFESQKSQLLKKLQKFKEVDFIDLGIDNLATMVSSEGCTIYSGKYLKSYKILNKF